MSTVSLMIPLGRFGSSESSSKASRRISLGICTATSPSITSKQTNKAEVDQTRLSTCVDVRDKGRRRREEASLVKESTAVVRRETVVNDCEGVLIGLRNDK